MNSRKALRNIFSEVLKKQPICNTCKHQKLGLTTMCHKYRRIPSSTQHGGSCEKFERIEVIE